jgi:hypothetical protein
MLVSLRFDDSRNAVSIFFKVLCRTGPDRHPGKYARTRERCQYLADEVYCTVWTVFCKPDRARIVLAARPEATAIPPSFGRYNHADVNAGATCAALAN